MRNNLARIYLFTTKGVFVGTHGDKLDRVISLLKILRAEDVRLGKRRDVGHVIKINIELYPYQNPILDNLWFSSWRTDYCQFNRRLKDSPDRIQSTYRTLDIKYHQERHCRRCFNRRCFNDLRNQIAPIRDIALAKAIKKSFCSILHQR